MDWKRVLDDFSKSFIKRRAEIEGFEPEKHSFFIHDPETQYISTLLTGYITPFYYMSPSEVFKLSYPLHKYVIDMDSDYHLETLKIARVFGAMKDQVMIGILMHTKHKDRNKHFDDLVKLLATFPPNQIVKKFIDTKRKVPQLFGGIGKFEKALLNAVWKKWEEAGKIEYYFAKYREYMQQIVNIAHIKVKKEEFSYLSNPTKYKGKSKYLKAVKRFFKNKNLEEIPEKMPFELIRSNIPKEKWDPIILKKCDITANTTVLMARSLYDVFGEEFLPYLERTVKNPFVTADKILKALLATKDEKLAKKLAEVYAEKVKITYEKLLLPLPEKPKAVLVMDASASMGHLFIKGLSVVAPFAPIIKKLVLFSDEADYEDETLLSTWEGIKKLVEIMKRKYHSGTDIVEGLLLALEQVESGEIDTVIIITDEQANVLKYEEDEMKVIKKLIEKGATVMVINPTPYPVRVTDIKEKKIIYVPAPNPEAFVGALKLVQIRKTKKHAKELLKKLKVVMKKKNNK